MSLKPESSLPEELDIRREEEAVELVAMGQKIWVQRTLDNFNGRVIDLYDKCRLIGSVEQDYDTGTCFAFVTGSNGPHDEPEVINPESLRFDEAMILVEAQIV